MTRTRLALAAVPLLSIALLATARPRGPLQAPGDVEHAALAPANALVYAEFRDADGLLERGLAHPFLATLLDAGLGGAIAAVAGVTPSEALAALDQRAGFEVLPALDGLAARGLGFSLHLRRARPAVLVTLRGEDAAGVERLLDLALARAAELAGHPGAFAAPTERRGDTALWRIGEKLVIARSGAWVLASADESVVIEALERVHGEETLAHAPAFARAHAARDSDATLWAWTDLAKLRAFQRLGGGDQGLLELERAATQPAVQFLLGPTLALLGSAKSLGLSLCLRGEDASLHAQAFGVAQGPACALLPVEDAAQRAQAGTADALHARVYRDLRGLFAARGELFPPQAQPGFAEAEGNLALFFGGRDVAEHVLPHLSPWFELVAREVAFAADAVPDAPLPALALLARVDDAQGIGGDLVAAFQTAISLVNVDRAQKAQPSLRLELAQHGAATITSARFAPPEPGSGVELRYNLEPACALVGATFVIGTHRALVAQLANELASDGARSPADDAVERLRLSGRALESLARAQRELLVMNRVLSDGVERERAEGEIALLISLLGCLELVELAAERTGDDAVSATFTLDLRALESAR
jgi:hypothetical protein